MGGAQHRHTAIGDDQYQPRRIAAKLGQAGAIKPAITPLAVAYP